jgi:hypothetical protein
MKGLLLILIPTVLLILIAVILLGVKVLFVKGGKFPSGHAHSSPALRERGVKCASQQLFEK